MTAVAVHRPTTRAVSFCALDGLAFSNFTRPSERALDARLLDPAARRRTTDVERTHRELRARLADGLRRDDADRFADVDHVAAREVAAVAHARRRRAAPGR